MYTISETAKFLGVSVPTLRRWEKSGKLPALRTVGGHRRYPEKYIDMYLKGNSLKNEKIEEEIIETPSDTTTTQFDITTQTEIQREPVVYARVSSFKQKKEGNLQRQIDRIIENGQLSKDVKIISEYGSGLNTDRRGLNRLLREVEQYKISEIYIEYKDRLTRFGYRFLERYCHYFGTKIIPISNNDIKSPAEELSEDIMALLICFSGKLGERTGSGVRQRHRAKQLAQSSAHNVIWPLIKKIRTMNNFRI